MNLLFIPKVSLFFFLLFPFFSVAQAPSSIELSSSLDFTNQVNSFIETEYRINYSINAAYNYALRERLFLKTGLGIRRVGDFYRQEVVFLNNSGSTLLPGSIVVASDHSFVEIPLHLRYVWAQEGLQPYVEGGISTDIYLRTRSVSKTTLDDKKSVTYLRLLDGFQAVEFAASIAVGFQKQMSAKHQAFVQSRMRMQLRKIRYYGVGVELGVRRLLEQRD